MAAAADRTGAWIFVGRLREVDCVESGPSLRLGIFGGTFDPIHEAHLAIAEAARDTFQLDRVLVIPAANPPHKSGAAASYADRLGMVELACLDRDRLEPSRLEEGEEQSYSIRTIEQIKESVCPSCRLFFIIGADAFAEITTWKRWHDVVMNVEFIVVTRPAAQYEIPEGARVHPLHEVLMPVSSSGIRAALKAGGERPAHLPQLVYEYIKAKRLYL
jgi:nicotinate-nucleotide adenylyltransferase